MKTTMEIQTWGRNITEEEIKSKVEHALEELNVDATDVKIYYTPEQNAIHYTFMSGKEERAGVIEL